jgi:RNA polymerase sigma factor (sigma-70 family)
MATVHRAAVVHYLRRVTAGTSGADLSDGQLLARFINGREESAFAALVQRHGPMVLGVCRRACGDWHAAEDAFQATFLVLARKASSLRRPERLAAWLHGVAHRTACKARSEAARRLARERQAARPPAAPSCDDLATREVRDILDEEIGRLPARNRIAVVLCYLEGKTNAEAAAILGCSRGSVATLLARARERLRRRLGQRGLAAAAGHGPLNVPALLAGSTVRAVVASVCGQGTQAATTAAALAEGVVRGMMLSKWKIAGTILLLTALAATGVGVTASRGGQVPAAVAEAQPPLERQTVAPPPVAPREVEEDEEDDRSVIARTEHFVVTARSRKVAVAIGLAAERLRKELAVLWLGKELPKWPDLLPIQVKTTSGGIGGATSFSFDKGNVLSQHMNLEGPLDALLQSSLPHEMTHVILAHAAGWPLPRWADEGAALLSESEAQRTRHLRIMAKVLDEERLIGLKKLFMLKDYPKDVMVLYAEGLSVVGYLVERGGRAKFLGFLKDGMEMGWDEALSKHYDIATVGDLEREWLAQLRKQLADKVPPPAGTLPRAQPQPLDRHTEATSPITRGQAIDVVPQAQRLALPPGAGPIQALAELRKDGQLKVWRAAMSYRSQAIDSGGRLTSIYVPVTSFTKSSYPLEEVKGYDMQGKRIAWKKLRDLLKEQTLVLLAPNGSPVDPLHLRLYKEGTILLVVPEEECAPPVATPPEPEVIDPFRR